MAPFCPNLSNKKVREKFEELTDIFGEDIAYFLWGKNGGYPLDYAPNGAPSILFKSLMDHYSDRKQALIAKAKVYSSNFKDWFGDWTKKYETGASKVIDFNDAVDFLFEVNPELSKIGTKSEYEQYIKTIFPNSISNSIYWHGTDSDFSDGLNTAKRGKGSGAPETRNEMYFNRQPWASLQYISGINRRIKDNEGFNNWVKLWWELKEALGNGRMDTDDWKNEIIGPNIRQNSPNKHGVFDRDKGGTHGKYLSERKARYGYENKSDKEFFEEVFDIRYGKETFNDWINRKRDEFKNLWNNRSVKNGIIPAILNIHNPIVEEGQNTYYEEQRKLFTQAKRNGNDAILSNKSKNEFGSDVAVVFNPNENVHFLGTKSDIEDFKKWKSNNQVSKVVDENGEPLVVYHGTSSAPFTIFDKGRIGSRNAFGTNTEGFYFTDSEENAKSIAITMHEGDIIINGEPLFKSDYPFMNSKYISEIVGYKVSDNFADREVAKSPYDVNVIKDYYKAIGKKVEITEVQKDTENIYPSFLNIKDMQIKDYGGRNLTDTSSVEFDSFITNTKDGGKLQNIKDGKFKLANTYFVKNPNQIKSATDNNGEFS